MPFDVSRRGVHAAPVYRSLTRPLLLMGGERELMLLSALGAGFLVLIIKTWASIVVGVVLWLVAALAFTRLAKHDAQMSRVYLRHLKYQSFYPARASRWGHIRERW